MSKSGFFSRRNAWHHQRTSHISSHNRLQGNDLGLLDQHRSSVELILVFAHLLRHLIDVGRDEMVWDDVSQFLEPEERYLSQELSFLWNTLRYKRYERFCV